MNNIPAVSFAPLQRRLPTVFFLFSFFLSSSGHGAPYCLTDGAWSNNNNNNNININITININTNININSSVWSNTSNNECVIAGAFCAYPKWTNASGPNQIKNGTPLPLRNAGISRL